MSTSRRSTRHIYTQGTVSDMTTHSQTAKTFDPSVEEMRRLLKGNRAGNLKGIYSVCSANRLVLEASFAQAVEDQSLLLIEATSNQVNQDGGYTGLTPAQFRDYVHAIAKDLHFPVERLILGGDHLGPYPWRAMPAESAMKKACAMVTAYASAGFNKIHLDASMSCSDDPVPLAAEEIARRAALLCDAAEAAVDGYPSKPVYIIGTEVPVPGGAQEEMEVAVTTTDSLQQTVDVHLQAFTNKGLMSAWERVIGVVVQPGVEFGNETVVDYVPEKALQLTSSLEKYEGIVFEAHSTDYQTGESLQSLVGDHFGILKVGPELTFMMREAIFGLACIEEEWIAAARRSGIRAIIERVMVEHPEHWKPYYHGDEWQVRFARSYSFSDRIRYYWPDREISKALAVLTQNLKEFPAPMPLIAQYLPRQAEAIRTGLIQNEATALIRHKIQESLSRYSEACGLKLRAMASSSL